MPPDTWNASTAGRWDVSSTAVAWPHDPQPPWHTQRWPDQRPGVYEVDPDLVDVEEFGDIVLVGPLGQAIAFGHDVVDAYPGDAVMAQWKGHWDSTHP